jgi:phage terminase Nu1 subunit (DNA packaging protein)
MPVTTRGKNVTRIEIADLFGVSHTTVDAWIKRGMPVVQRGSRGKAWQINTAEVSAWLEQRAKESAAGGDQADERELKRRKLAAETAKVELELARVRGEVVPLAQLERALANTFAEVKTNLRSVPSRVATAIIGEETETRIKAVILKEIDQALEALGDFDLEEPDSDDD